MCATDLWAHIKFMHPILSLKSGVTRRFTQFGIWGREDLGFLIALVKFVREPGARELGGGHFFLATDRLMVYLFLSTDSSTLNMIIYSDRQLITK